MSEFKMNDDNFERILKQYFQQTQDYIDDDGFTGRLISQLPGKEEFNPWVKQLIFWVPLLLVSILVLSNLPVLHLVHGVSAFFFAMTIKEVVLSGIFVAMAVLSMGYFLLSDNPA
jgi:Domain of unknown function (DUF5056)